VKSSSSTAVGCFGPRTIGSSSCRVLLRLRAQARSSVINHWSQRLPIRCIFLRSMRYRGPLPFIAYRPDFANSATFVGTLGSGGLRSSIVRQCDGYHADRGAHMVPILSQRARFSGRTFPHGHRPGGDRHHRGEWHGVSGRATCLCCALRYPASRPGYRWGDCGAGLRT